MESESRMSRKTSHFTSSEKERLVRLVHDNRYKQILTAKTSSKVSVRERNQTWDKICQMFNAESEECIRNTKQLRTCYKNLKTGLKKTIAEHNGVLYESDKRILDILGMQIKPERNGFDVNAVNHDISGSSRVYEEDQDTELDVDEPSSSEAVDDVPLPRPASDSVGDLALSSKCDKEQYFKLIKENAMMQRRHLTQKRQEEMERRQEEKAAASLNKQYMLAKIQHEEEAHQNHEKREAEAHALNLRLLEAKLRKYNDPL